MDDIICAVVIDVTLRCVINTVGDTNVAKVTENSQSVFRALKQLDTYVPHCEFLAWDIRTLASETL
jgi:hypothetical protein